ncbi:MAG: lysophospholipid acyltransferase family protein [Firmicutes bacterium]|nr:lysophospholipid acyltransferase family protein [Bacillota bacterium]
MFYNIIRGLLSFFLFFVFRISVYGKGNVLKDGGVIFAVNHRSNWDPVILGITSPRKLSFMAKSELFRNKFFGAILRHLGAFPVQRGKGDVSAVKTSLHILKSEGAMIMFPEGKRVKPNEHTAAKPGIAMIATHARVPIIPVSISGKYCWIGKITVKYGEPIYFDEYYDEKLTIERLQELSQSVMDRIYSSENASEEQK